MSYNYSNSDKNNLKWFLEDNSCATLKTIKVVNGQVRGLRKITVDFQYPITAIAGRNGSGKTTVLTLAACAFHNIPSGFKLASRIKSYYTFSEFFIQTKEETALGDIQIRYEILYDRWKNGAQAGAGWQLRKKKSGGRWNNYEFRAERTVVFLGIERIVPHSERSISKSYRDKFKQAANNNGWEDNVREVVGRILSTDYTSFNYKHHSKYRLPVVAKKDQKFYSGFNMGAGEHSLFELFAIINECPKGSLILIDEIELGLHEKAQENLIKELKEVCKKRKFQIICTTHSSRILESLPPEGRIFLERSGTETEITPEISPAYATGKLSGRPNIELDILVEDEAAKLILETVLDKELRVRTQVLPIGSSSAVMRHLAARYKDSRHKKDRIVEVCVFLDGDKSSSKNTQVKLFLDALENSKEQDGAKEWVEEHLSFIPGNEWPESWVVKPSNRNPFYERFGREMGMSASEVDEMLDSSARAGKHNEFYEAAKILNYDKTIVANHLIKSAFELNPEESQKIANFVRNFLG